jgi:hypothetical protein
MTGDITDKNRCEMYQVAFYTLFPYKSTNPTFASLIEFLAYDLLNWSYLNDKKALFHQKGR